MTRKLKDWREFNCLRCGVVSKTKYDHQKFCSNNCKLLYARETYNFKPIEPIEWKCECGEVFYRTHWRDRRQYCDKCRLKYKRIRYRIKTVKRQNAVAGVRLSAHDIADRDGFFCYLCGKSVDMSLSGMHQFGATVDHVVPLSKGGKDVLENVRLAHRVCNIRKGNRVDA